MGGNTGRSDHKANGNSAGFRTDSAISAGRFGAERKLQRWVPDDADTFDMTLEKANDGGSWDQFRENERRFGLKSDYDENIYTTPINRDHPQHKERVAAADKKAREIERSAATTAHVAEERIMDFVGGDGKDDEEDKYSGVKRQDFPPLPGNRENKYTPPARRAPAASSTVKGAPVDPAIISSQLKAPTKTSPAPKVDESRSKPPKPDVTATPAAPKATEAKPDVKDDAQPRGANTKTSSQAALPLKAPAAAGRTVSPQGKEAAPSATSTVERDVLKEFKTFANQQRLNAEKARSTKAKADKEVKLTELKKFADSFKLPTLVPVDLIPIIAKDPAKQREIQEKAQRDVDLMAKRKADEVAAKEKKGSISKETPAAAPAASAEASSAQANASVNNAKQPARAAAAPSNAQPSAGQQPRHQNNRASYAPPYNQYQGGNRPGPPHMQGGRQSGGLSARIRNMEQQKAQQSMMQGDMRMPPTGPANAGAPAYNRPMPPMANQMGGKLNPNSHEFRPSPFAASFSPNGHPSATSSPRSGPNNANEAQSATGAAASLVVVTRKRKAVDPKKCVILSFIKTTAPPENKNWNENDGLRPSYDTLPTWRTLADNEKPDSTMHLTYNEYLEKQPFAAQPTPNTAHVMPQMAHQHQLPFHLQHGAHSFGPRHSPHVQPVQMHGGHHGPGPHVPYNGNDDHRMMHSNSTQSYSSPRMGQVPMAHPPNMNSPGQMPYNQPGMQQFMGGGQPGMNQFGRSFSNNGSYMPQPGAMGGPMMMPGQFMNAQGMVAPPQMQMYQPGHPQFIPQGSGPPQQMPGANGYPSPGRPSASMMVHQGSQQGQQVYGMSPGMHYQQPAYAPQQQGPMNPSRGYNNQGPQHFGTSPSQAHHYGAQRGSNNSFKNSPSHNSPATQSGHPTPPAQTRAPDAAASEAK
ncbi:hypothetical protein Micbo1qcDRAFT_200116 [Microdochium bolleyi]|uniref:LsmAD domain-containing protein n=1 Tax=Microdochium bolleyi TaxID=196109 RepID=A0A136JJW1_9PEZI|nr:hypothetical protein Micbo1qcDRAFT_200116 [Microdochium bolleyi]